jgi:hypothetical protein
MSETRGGLLLRGWREVGSSPTVVLDSGGDRKMSRNGESSTSNLGTTLACCRGPPSSRLLLRQRCDFFLLGVGLAVLGMGCSGVAMVDGQRLWFC